MKKWMIAVLCLIMPGGTADAQASPIPPGGTIAFTIMRNGSEFGTHQIDFNQADGGQVTVDIAIRMDYDLGPIKLFHYDHKNREVWDGNILRSVNAVTDDDGTPFVVNVTPPDGVFSTSYWNKAVLKTGKVANTQKGTLDSIIVTPMGIEEFCTAVECMMAEKMRIEGDSLSSPLSLWYDAQTGQWIGLEFAARGSDIRYIRNTPVHEPEAPHG